MKIDQIIDEGFLDDIRSAYRSGKRDYIVRQAEKMGVSPEELTRKATQQAPEQPAPAQPAEPAPKQRVRVPAGSAPVTPPQPVKPAEPTQTTPAQAAPASRPTFDTLLPSIEKMSKQEQSKLLVHLLQTSKSKISAAK
jgi:hypothetical protein